MAIARVENDPASPLEPDEALIRRVRGGELNAFGLIMRRHNQRLFRVARAILRDETEAEDVVQMAYVAAYTHLHAFEGAAAFSTWLTRITVNQALSRLRDLQRHRRLLAGGFAAEWRDSASEASSPEEAASAGELARMLGDAIDALPDAYRAIVVLRELDGMSTQQVAACLSISPESVRVRLHRARMLLRTLLRQRAGELARDVFPFAGERCDRIVARVLAAISMRR